MMETAGSNGKNNGLGDSSVYSLIIVGQIFSPGHTTASFVRPITAQTGLRPIQGYRRIIVFLPLLQATMGRGETNLFAGTDGGGVFLSTNNGTNSGAVNDGFPRDCPIRYVVNFRFLT